MRYFVIISRIYIPFGGLIHKWYGTKEVESKYFQHYMENNENIMFLPGGYEEATITEFKKEKAFIKYN